MNTSDGIRKGFFPAAARSLPGVLLFVTVAVVAWYITPKFTALHPQIQNLNISNFIIAIILGMIIGNTIGIPEICKPGLQYSTTLTKTGIVVMGCKYSFAGLLKTGSEALIIIAVFLFTSAFILMWLGRRLSMSPSLSACLAAGLSVCGVSACVAIAPAVRAKNEDIAYTIAVVLLFGLLALFTFPFIGQMFDLSANPFGTFSGFALINSAPVLSAGLACCQDVGTGDGVFYSWCLYCLPLVVLALALMTAAADVKVQAQLAKISKWKLMMDKFPVFVLGFLAVVMINTFDGLTASQVKRASVFMDWCFLLGFASIGLTTRLADIKAAGFSGAALGFIVAGTKAVLALLVVLYFLQ